MRRVLKITLIVALIGIVVAAIATGLILHFKQKSDSAAISSNQTTTTVIQQNISTSRMTTTIYRSSSVIVTNAATTTNSIITTRASTSTTRSATNNLTVTRVSSAITYDSQAFCPSEDCSISPYYFEAFQLNVTTTGFYIIKCNGSTDMYGLLYAGVFNPFTPSITLIQNGYDVYDDSYQGVLNMTLQASIQYIVVVTTYDSYTDGSYVLTLTGPASVRLSKIVGAGLQSQQSIYSSSLTRNNPSFCQFSSCDAGEFAYFAAFNVNVSMDTTYLISSSSNFDTLGYFYQNYFNASNPSQNIIGADDESAGYSQFALSLYLRVVSRYILVFTTYSFNRTGSFSLLADKPGLISLTPR
ncbi:hypothetical protein I4U23_027471 [Adineta vaga]|nr:hypothetical protein I4U23_027471 [Adineta vaga]